MTPKAAEDPAFALLERIADTLERIEEALAQMSAKLDTANEQLVDLNQSQRA